MAFRFRLDTVLKVREGLEKQEERALERIVLEISRTRREIEQADEATAQARREWQEALRSATAAVHLQSMLERERCFGVAKQRLQEMLAKLEAARDEQVKRYQAAHRDHESLLNIRRQQLAEYERQQARSEQKMVDDIFGARRR